MYNLTKSKLNNDLNLVKIIKNLRYQKILAKSNTMTKEVKNQIKHQDKNLLNLEDTSDIDSALELSSELDLDLDSNSQAA